MKTFKDLLFKKYTDGIRSIIYFKNGYGVSVINTIGSYTSNDNEYEVGILFNDSLCYTTYITSDVIGYCDEKKVTDIMKRVQKL